jgi:hypothetical protein
MNSGAFHHMIGSREVFTNFSNEDSELHVELGNDVRCVVEGIGTIQFQPKSRSPFEVTDVLYVPGLTKAYSQSQPWRTRGLKSISRMDRYLPGR